MALPSDLQKCYRAIPAVQDLLQDGRISGFAIDTVYLKTIIQQEITRLREKIAAGKSFPPTDVPELLLKAITARLRRLLQPSLRRVVNATGIMLHTNMGRAPFSDATREHLHNVIENYCNIEIDLESGKRGKRSDHVEELLCLITGAEAALVVNNCAAGVLLALNSLANRKEVPVSRGELVEIGGSFRMPDVMKASNTKMVEIGTTNKTHLRDYETAITAKTAALLKVHTSNYRILGFTGSTGISELAGLAHKHQLPLVYDMGSGVLEDLQQWGLPYEPAAREMIEAGVDVLIFSGDKLLGGPQAGIIVGRKTYVDKCKKNHLTRALRCDKLIYTALESTLRLYLQFTQLPDKLPVARMLTTSPDTLRVRAEQLRAGLPDEQLTVEIVDTYSQMGSGALPLEKIPSVALRILSPKLSPIRMAQKLRENDPPVVGYVQDDGFLLNLRTVREDELEMILQALTAVANN